MEPLDETLSLLGEREEEESEEYYYKHNLALPKIPILISLFLGSFMSSLDGTIVANIMNKVAEEFAESDKKQWIATSYLLTNTAFQPLYGKLADVTGRKFALLTAYSFFGLGCLMTCFASNITTFSIARAICGIGGGGIGACTSITISDICTAKERGIYQGYQNVVFGLGQMLGAPLGGLFIDTIGWRAIFGIQVPIIAICAILVIKNVNIKLSHVPPVSERFTLENLSRIDIFGSTSLATTISGLILLCSTEINKIYLILFTLVSFIAFIWVERYYAKEKILPIELLRGSFGLCSAATVVSSFIIFGDIFRSPVYLQLIHNISVTKTGLFLIFPSISVAAGSLVSGWILRKTKMDLALCAYIIVLGGVFLQLVGLLISYGLVGIVEPASEATNDASMLAVTTIQLPSNTISWKILYVMASVFVAFGYSCLLVATLVSIVFTVEKSQQATMTGIFYLWRSIGNVLGASLTLIVFDNSLARLLWNYMFKSSKDTSYNFSREEYESLIIDTSYLRLHFPSQVIMNLLKVYRNSFLISYLPNIGLAVIGTFVSWILVWTYRTRPNH